MPLPFRFNQNRVRVLLKADIRQRESRVRCVPQADP